MNLYFDQTKAEGYRSKSQVARVLTEHWAKKNCYCPSCGNLALNSFPNNQPVADLYCKRCSEQFELKSRSGERVGKKAPDSAYKKMIERIVSSENPNFFFLTYDKTEWMVSNFLVIPNFYFTPDIIEKRKPLAKNAKRSGWVGCDILLNKIPESGKVYIVRNKEIQPKAEVLREWNKTSFLENSKLDQREWLIDVLKIVEQIQSEYFTLAQIYSFERSLSSKYPNNNNVRAKIRQKLQVLRDKGVIEFVRRGVYRKLS
ncbi:Type-2 restriction enzyme DpnI [Sedimentisphaera cyanobacteriorum]|uniref:Type-2 restriction enzyme DpnI n=1 Tax=Sedimentisphaera cyanobacteriorum TaxID=1940790 RepID=A0A1Q2HL95_9BACT|nr:DpnI domain-containing protein [Sedimentisphaera cyanobacteriorum]AQQ08349.1 Type-2 restriction enzyme DpnI [Sedimentisphaera cyanobacteriorum]